MRLGKEIKDFVDVFTKHQKALNEKDWHDKYYEIQMENLKSKNKPDAAEAAGNAAVSDFDKRGAGGVTPSGKPTPINDPASDDLPPEQKAVLNAIASPESAGAYDVRYTPKGGVKFAGFDAHPNVLEDTADGKKSSAAGRYQFVGTTWRGLPENVRGTDFQPKTQDRAALYQAQQVYKKATGRDLFADVKAKGFTKETAAALSSEWTGLRDNPQKAIDAYTSSIKRYTPQQRAAIEDAEAAQYAAQGGMIKRYAGGGLAEGDQSNNDYFMEEQQRSPQQASLAQIIHGGLSEIAKQVTPARAAVTDAAPAGANLHKEDGGISAEDVKAIDQAIDPDGKLTDSLRGIARLNGIYNHYLKQGDIDKANKAAASLIQFTQHQVAGLGVVAEKALQQGRPDIAVAALKKAHDNTPTGTTLEVDPATQTVVEKDDQTGKVVTQAKYSPEMLLTMARATSNGSMYWKQLMGAGRKHLPEADQPEDTPSAALSGGIGALAGATAAPAPAARTPAVAEPTEDDEEQPTSVGSAPAQPKYDAALASKLSPKERKQYEAAYTKSLADYKAAAQKFESDRKDARIETKADRANYQKRLGDAEGSIGTAYDNMIEELKKQTPDIEKQITPAIKRTMTTAAQHIYAGNSLTSGQAVMAAASMFDVDEKNPDKQNFTISKSGKDAMIKFGNGMKAKMPKDVVADMLAIRASHVKKVKDTIEKARKVETDRASGNDQAAAGTGALAREVILPQPSSTRAGPQTPGLPDYEGAPMPGGDKFSRPLGPRLAIP